MRTILTILSVVLLAACSSPAEPDARWEEPERIQFAASLGIDLTQMTLTQSGLYLHDLVVGTGAVAGVGNMVTVHYSGWFPDGVMFDTSRDKSPLDFPLGVGWAIKGWDEGLVGMRVGGRRQLVIRSSLAYGRSGKGPIPPLTTLVFDVEMLNVRP